MEPKMDSGSVLKAPINLSDLLNGGTEFQIDTEFNDHEGDEYFLDDDYGSADEDDERYKQLQTPWERTFDELRQEMDQINEHLYKRVTKAGVGEPIPDSTRVVIEYNAFFEGESKPFDSTTLRDKPHRFVVGKSNVLLGLELAVRTMRVSEEAQFVIAYQLMYGEFGCLQRVKPKADVLFVIRLISATPVSDGEALAKLNETERRTYATVKDKVTEIRQYARDCFQRNLVPNAIVKYLEAVHTLQTCQLKDEAEQAEQQKTLIALYTSLAVCYNRRDRPKDACRMVNELRRLCDVSKSAKILYQEGKALMSLGEYDRARKCLLRAQQLEPQDEIVQQVLKQLNDRSVKHQQEEKKIWSRAFGLAEKKEKQLSAEDTELLDNMKQTIQLFVEDEGSSTLPLPDGLTDRELALMDQLASELNLKLNVHVTNNKKNYKLQK
ncbi:inactive peptidyl-prolyl cis-trans isomerase shutdown-like [Anopheles arabiensis]|uniref:peptidylprolyl isomerase n=1 Tax=Anopheles arabiensis TaxID=7173 RepID=A0A182HNK2_ANOAR|nr:inactive peptidyl-prolyl cis-trans isomerase shutdown-like [Anopheles arabiensis]